MRGIMIYKLQAVRSLLVLCRFVHILALFARTVLLKRRYVSPSAGPLHFCCIRWALTNLAALKLQTQRFAQREVRIEGIEINVGTLGF